MPRGRRMRNARNPYGSMGGYVDTGVRGRNLGRMGNMGFPYDMAGGNMMYANNNDMARGGRGRSDRNQGSNDYNNNYNNDYAYNDMERGNRQDGHYPMEQGSMYYPIEAMGRFSGYWGEMQDHARGGGRGRGRDRRMDMGYEDMRMGMDGAYYPQELRYRNDFAGDFGERLSKQELEEWKKELLQKVEEKDKHFFEVSNIIPKAKQLGAQMKEYNEEELIVTTALVYNDYCKTGKKYVGNNLDFFIEIAKDWLEDKTSEITGGEKLAVYYDCIVIGEY